MRPGLLAAGSVLYCLLLAHGGLLLPGSDERSNPIYERALDLGMSSLVNSPLSIGLFWGALYLVILIGSALLPARRRDRSVSF